VPDREQRHMQPGRRESDRRDYAAGVVVSAMVDEDRLFPTWRKEDVIKWLTILSMAGGIAVAVITFFSTRFASRREIEDKVAPIEKKMDAFAGSTNIRLNAIELRQEDAEAVHRLLVPMARLQCLDYQRQNSLSLADAAGLPCDSLLNRRR
jgi:hypothetical protein